MTPKKSLFRQAQHQVSNPMSPEVAVAENTPNPSQELVPDLSVRNRGDTFLTPFRPKPQSSSTASSTSTKSSVASGSSIFDALVIDDSEPESPITPFDTPQIIGEKSRFFKGSSTRLYVPDPVSQNPPGSSVASLDVQDCSPRRFKRRGRPATEKQRGLKTDQSPPNLESSTTPQVPAVEAVLENHSPPKTIVENKSPLVDNLSKAEDCRPDEISLLQLSNIEDVNAGIPEVEHIPRNDLLEFKNFQKKKNRRAINNSIIKTLRKPKVSTSTKSLKKGYIYMYTSLQNAPNHLKIGKTNQLPEERIQEWQKKCGLKLSEIPLGEEHMNPFPHFSVVESLIKVEFSNERKEHNCHRCIREKKHDEWYEVEQEKALIAIRRWITWIITYEPFDEKSRLKPYWKWKLARESKVVDTIDWNAWTQETGKMFSRNNIEYFLETYDARRSLKSIIRVEAKKDWRFISVAIIVILSLCLFRGIFDAVLFFGVMLVL